MRIAPRLLILLLLPISSLQAEETPNRTATSFYGMSLKTDKDFSKLKLLAEQGVLDAQMKLAKACMDNMRYADALKWYSAASEQGVTEALYRKGHMLLFGCEGAGNQSVAAQPEVGFKAAFMAATNGYMPACLDVAVAYRDGRGCPADPVVAYAWFSYCTDHGNTDSHTSLNRLALRLSGEQIRAGLALARETKQGHWPTPDLAEEAATHVKPKVDINLKLSGVVCSPHGNFVVINKRTLAQGETVQLKSEKNEPVDVTCVSVSPDSVQVRVAGEEEVRTLIPDQY
ncbi:MAG TPA: tetratricopeptide repeat protein [Verrucomicrobiae bacterium]